MYAAEVKIKLITKKGTDEGSNDNTAYVQIALKREEAGHDQDGFPFQKSSGEQYPISVYFEVVPKKLLEVHSSAPVSRFRATESGL